MRRGTTARLVLLLVSLTGTLTFWSAERRSLERANRLHRDGRSEEAVSLYEARTADAPSDAELRYNLGTTLAELASPEAELELARASQSGPREIRGRALYNTGVLKLNEAMEASDPDSVRAGATAAVEANRTALRFRPDDPDAKWNLAMALRLLDSIASHERRSGREVTDGAVEADVVSRSVNVPDAEEDERAEDPPAEGERETVAVAGDESPLALTDALDLLGESHLDPRDLLGKLLGMEGRTRPARPSAGARRW